MRACVRAFASMFVSDGVLIKYYEIQSFDHHWYGIDLQEKEKKAKTRHKEEETDVHEEEEEAPADMSLRRLTSIF